VPFDGCRDGNKVGVKCGCSDADGPQLRPSTQPGVAFFPRGGAEVSKDRARITEIEGPASACRTEDLGALGVSPFPRAKSKLPIPTADKRKKKHRKVAYRRSAGSVVDGGPLDARLDYCRGKPGRGPNGGQPDLVQASPRSSGVVRLTQSKWPHWIVARGA